MATFKLDGADINYAVSGQGPTLILIPGANGTGDVFRATVPFLAKHFTTVTFDRRNYGASKLTAALPDELRNPDSTYRLQRDASDVIALANQISGSVPINIMGSSSGSIVAMETLQDYPEMIERAIFHESPITTHLLNAKQLQDNNSEVVATALNGNFEVAFAKFAEFMRLGPIDAKMMSHAGTDFSDTNNPMVRGIRFWFQYEVRQYTSRKIDFLKFKDLYRKKIALLVGTDSAGSFPIEVMTDLSEYLDLPAIDIPGGHLGYAAKPEGFATTLMAILRR